MPTKKNNPQLYTHERQKLTNYSYAIIRDSLTNCCTHFYSPINNKIFHIASHPSYPSTMLKQHRFPAITLSPSTILQFLKTLKILNKMCMNTADSELAQLRRKKFLNFNQSHNNSFIVLKQRYLSGVPANREKFFNFSRSHNILMTVPQQRCLSGATATPQKIS